MILSVRADYVLRPLHLILRYGDGFTHLRLIQLGQLQWSELEGQLVDLAVEAERHLIVLVVHRRMRIYSNVKGLVTHHQECDCVRDLPRSDDLVVHLQHTGAALRDAGTVIREVEHDRKGTRQIRKVFR
jgi:hypothetical protein